GTVHCRRRAGRRTEASPVTILTRETFPSVTTYGLPQGSRRINEDRFSKRCGLRVGIERWIFLMAANRSNADLSGKRILVVEDEGIVAFWVSEVLTSAGAAVIGPAASVREALALLENGAVDGAVLDYKLESGTTTTAVADLLAAKDVPFAFATGY